MKYFMPVLGLVTIICIVAGTYMHVGGGLRIFDNPVISLGSGSDKSSEGKDISFSENYENVDKLDINMAFGDVTIIEGSELNVSFEGHDDLKPEVNVEDGTLKIKQTKKVRVKGIDYSNYESALTVTVPSDANIRKVEADLDMGDLEIRNISCKDLGVDMSMGDLDVIEVTADTIEVDNDMGGCEIKNCKFDKLEGNCDMGDIQVKVDGDVDDYAITAKCDLGRVGIDGDDKGNSYSVKGDKKITLNVSMGNIDVN